MLSPLTLHHLAHSTCHRCGETLGRFHVYTLTDPAEVLRQTTEHGPTHIECAHEHADALHRAELIANPNFPGALLYALYVVKGSPSSPSARIIRLVEEDETTQELLLFSPDRITFFHHTIAGPDSATREATYEEIESVMEPATTEAGLDASDAEKEEIVRQVHRLHKFLPKRPKPEAPAEPLPPQ